MKKLLLRGAWIVMLSSLVFSCKPSANTPQVDTIEGIYIGTSVKSQPTHNALYHSTGFTPEAEGRRNTSVSLRDTIFVEKTGLNSFRIRGTGYMESVNGWNHRDFEWTPFTIYEIEDGFVGHYQNELAFQFDEDGKIFLTNYIESNSPGKDPKWTEIQFTGLR